MILIISLKAHQLIFFNNFFMSANQVNQSQMINELFYPSFIDEGFKLGENAPDIMMHSEPMLIQNTTNTSSPKGKGRPKGQKNCKDRERKPKTILNEENRRKGHWSLEENKRYHWFLQIYNKHFICKQMRRLDKIFKTMAVFIGSRQAEQCRSHHQKMQKKYHSFPSIILYLRKFHYGTEDQRSVEEDMRNNEIQEEFALISCKQLIELQIINEAPTISNIPEEAKISNEPQKQFQLQENWLDLLNDNYQHRFQFDNLLL